MSRCSLFCISCLILSLSNCAPVKNKSGEKHFSGEITPLHFAKGFTIVNYGKYRKISVTNPWEKSGGVSFEYFLVDRDKDIPIELAEKRVIRTPVKKVICLSTSHVGFLSALHVIPSLVALSGAAYVSDPEVLKAVSTKDIVDIGYDQSMNYELILSLKPDLIMAYGVAGEVTGCNNKLQD